MPIIEAIYALADLEARRTLRRGDLGELKVRDMQLGVRVWLKGQRATVEQRLGRYWFEMYSYDPPKEGT